MRAFFLFFSCSVFLFSNTQEEFVEVPSISVEEQVPETQANTYFGDENDPKQEEDTKEEDTPKQQDQPEVTKQPMQCDFYYGSRFTVGGFYRYQDHAFEKNNSTFFGEVDLLIPILQSSRTIFFLDVRGLDFEGKPIEGNFGLGIRHMFENYDWMFGLYSFYDVRRTAHRNTFGQITAGFEVKTKKFTFDANGYFPVGDTSKRAKFFDKADLVSGANNFENILFVRGMELALWGFDGEVGYKFGQYFSFFAGGFYFHKNHAKTLAGPMARMNLTFDTNSKTAFLFDQIILDAGGSYDHVRNLRFYAGLKLSWLIGEKKGREPKEGLAKRMTEYVRRDYDVTTSGNNDVALQRLNKANGTPILVRRVSDKTGLNLAITNQADVIGIQGAITTVGDITLNDDQTITGGYYIFDDGIQIKLSDGGQIENFDVMVGKNNTIRDLTFKSSEITNLGKVHVGTLMIDNINIDRDVVLVVELTGGSSNVYLNNSTFSASGQFVLINAITSAAVSSTLTLKQFNYNTFNVVASADDYSPVDIRNFSYADNAIIIVNVEEMRKNVLNVASGVYTGVKGIFLFNEAQFNTNVQQTFNVTHLADNEVNIDGASTQAIFGYNSVTGGGTSVTQVMNFDQVLSNTVNTTNSTGSSGIYFSNEQADLSTSNQKMNITSLVGNDVEISAGGSNQGIFLNNNISSSLNIAQINVGSSSSGGFFNNIVGLGAASTDDISLTNNATNGVININVNSFGQDLSQANYNAEIDKSGSNQGGITITP